jgi:predicted enzyme related to lactoylglutathione lyase
MSAIHGRFVWYELMTTDRAAAQAFYTRVVGWKHLASAIPGTNYDMFAAGETPIAGMIDQPEDSRKMGTPPCWVGYVGVDDVDAAAAKATATGGKIYVPPTDIPSVGRFAIMADPQGAALALFKPADTSQPPPSPEGVGHVGWHELYAADGATALDFYTGLFGWQKQEAMDMGPMGVYQMFGFGETMLGGIMTKPPEVPVPNWHYYFCVDGIEAAIERVKAAGGQSLVGPQEVPGGAFIMMGIDPQGALFALVGGR